MVKDFNFYDVYGYFLPGFTLLTLIWLPFGLIQRSFPTPELSSALVIIAFGYIAGHLLQIMAQNALPSTINDSQGRSRYPSDVMFDEDNDVFSQEERDQLKQRIVSKFGEAFKSRPQNAFFLCRSFLVQHKVASYAEQFEGMYALMRGLAAAFGLGFVYHVGWALTGNLVGWGSLICGVIGVVLFLSVIVILSAIPYLQRKLGATPALKRPSKYKIIICFALAMLPLITAYWFGINRWSWLAVGIGLSGAILTHLIPDSKKVEGEKKWLWLSKLMAGIKVAPIVFTLLALGYSSGLEIKEMTPVYRGWLLALVLIGMLASLKFFSSYQFFASEFAKAVYRDFLAYEEIKTSQAQD
jgi:hypothetical protein